MMLNVLIVAHMMLLGGVGMESAIVGIAVRIALKCLTIMLIPFPHAQEFFLGIGST